MGLINKGDKPRLKVIDEGVRRFPGFSTGQMSGIIFNPRTKTSGRHHIHVIFGASVEPLLFQQLVVFFKIPTSLLQFPLYVSNGFVDF